MRYTGRSQLARLGVFLFLIIGLRISYGQESPDVLFEDVQFEPIDKSGHDIFFTSESVDFIQIPSTISDSVQFAVVTYKPQKPSRILLLSHGWHMSVRPPKDAQNPYPDFLTIQVDMRGRKYSTGVQDCNGYELYDFYDAYQYALKHYSNLISEATQVYFFGGSGGGGNGLGLLGKFPDLFCSSVILAPMSDYALWFEQDTVGEFRDEMIPWIGYTPMENNEAYRSRSGITTVSNLLTPVYLIHGGTDVRVPVVHSQNYVEAAKEFDKPITYLELDNVGTRAHWGNITQRQEDLKSDMVSRGLSYHPSPVLPKNGRLVIAGFIVTRHFSVFLDSIDAVGVIRYDLATKSIEFLEGTGQFEWYD